MSLGLHGIGSGDSDRGFALELLLLSMGWVWLLLSPYRERGTAISGRPIARGGAWSAIDRISACPSCASPDQVPEACSAGVACTTDRPQKFQRCRSPDVPEASTSPPIHYSGGLARSYDRDISTVQGLHEDRAGLREDRIGLGGGVVVVVVDGAEEAYAKSRRGDESARCEYTLIGIDDDDDQDRCQKGSVGPARHPARHDRAERGSK
jgi:hypothetical protein